MKFTLLFLFLLPLYLCAQVVLSGRVTDDAGEALGFATVRLLAKAGAELTAGTTTNAAGAFRLTAAPGVYQLRVDYLGYTTYDLELPLTETTTLSDVILQPAGNELAEIVVRGDRPVLEQHENRLWFNVAASPLATGYDGLEVLGQSPNVWLTDEGTVLVRNEAAQVLLNGRPLSLSGPELAAYLQALPSENILRIEVQTSAGAATAATTAGGVVNIVLKKPVRGVNGQARAAYLLRGEDSWSATTGLSLNYGGKVWNIYGNYDFLDNRTFSEQLNTTDYFTINDFLDERQLSFGNLSRHTYRLGAVVEPRPGHIIGGELSGNTSDYAFNQSNQLLLTSGGEEKARGNTLSVGDREMFTNNATLNYTWKMDTSGTQLQLFADYIQGSVHWLNATDSRYENGYIPDNEDRNLTDNQTNIYDLQADLTKPMPSGAKLLLGLKWTGTRRNNVLIAESLEEVGWVTNERSSIFDYAENIAAAFASVSHRLSARDFLRVGLRAERTDLTKTNLQDGSIIGQGYLNFFPSVFLSREVTAQTTLSLSYTKRLQRPSFRDLNNNVWKLNDFRYELGNPDLAPEIRHRYELAVQTGKHNAALFYNNVADAINGIYFLEGEIAYYKKFNEGRQTEYGLEYNSALDPLPWYNLRTSIRFFNRQFIDAADQEIFQQTTLKLRLWHNLKFGAKTRAEIRTTWYSPQADAYFIRDPLREVDVLLQRQILGKQLNVRFHVHDLFRTLNFAHRRPFSTFTTTSVWRPFTRTFNLRLAYNFASQHKVTTRSNRSQNETRRRM